MKEIRIKVDDTKQSEIDAIKRLHEYFLGTGLYLESLFTIRLFQWVEMQIKNDFPPDIHSYLLKDEDRRKYEVKIQDLQDALETCEKKFRIENEMRNSETLAYEDSLSQYKFRLQATQDQRDECRTLNYNLANERNQLLGKVENLESELLRLKARLFDLTEKKEE